MPQSPTSPTPDQCSYQEAPALLRDDAMGLQAILPERKSRARRWRLGSLAFLDPYRFLFLVALIVACFSQDRKVQLGSAISGILILFSEWLRSQMQIELRTMRLSGLDLDVNQYLGYLI